MGVWGSHRRSIHSHIYEFAVGGGVGGVRVLSFNPSHRRRTLLWGSPPLGSAGLRTPRDDLAPGASSGRCPRRKQPPGPSVAGWWVRWDRRRLRVVPERLTLFTSSTFVWAPWISLRDYKSQPPPTFTSLRPQIHPLWVLLGTGHTTPKRMLMGVRPRKGPRGWTWNRGRVRLSQTIVDESGDYLSYPKSIL